jgi:hypothetical protein
MAKKLTRAEKIRRYLTANPNMALKDVAARFDTTYQTVYMVRKNMPKRIAITATEATLAKKAGVSTAEYAKQKVKFLKDAKKMKLRQPPPPLPVPETRGAWVHRWIDTNKLDEDLKDKLASQLITMEEPASDPVNHPAHYKTGGIETIDFIEAKEFNYNMGNAVKYISRAEHKGNKQQDLEKAIWYLNRELAKA